MRYKGIKGKFWEVFAKYIRLRDYKTHGTCITCGARKTYEELQAGHYLAAGNCGFGLLFHEDNVNGECPYDNGFNPNHQHEYRTNLIKRIGLERVTSLEQSYKDSHYRGKVTREWSKKEYEAKIAEYKQKIKDLHP